MTALSELPINLLDRVAYLYQSADILKDSMRSIIEYPIADMLYDIRF